MVKRFNNKAEAGVITLKCVHSQSTISYVIYTPSIINYFLAKT